MLQAGYAFFGYGPLWLDVDSFGQVDGTVVIFDVETNGVARKLRGHTRQIQSLRWGDCATDEVTLTDSSSAGLVMEDIY